ncbi:MAG: diaminopimelate epimerase, partial [Dokdonella sp.]
MTRAFTKMHGIGNDFVVIDCREQPLGLDADAIRQLGNRHAGVGFDQLLTIEPARDPDCAFAYGIWNADGSPSGQCGNGARCVAAWLARAGLLGKGSARLQSPSGTVAVELIEDGRVRVDMGEPRFAPSSVPIAVAVESDTYTIDVVGHTLEVGAVSMGNPHAVIKVDDVREAAVNVLGPQIEHAGVFPLGCNVGFAQVLTRGEIVLRVWERGVGETLACGTGACAAVAVLHRRGVLDAQVRVSLAGGALDI